MILFKTIQPRIIVNQHIKSIYEGWKKSRKQLENKTVKEIENKIIRY